MRCNKIVYNSRLIQKKYNKTELDYNLVEEDLHWFSLIRVALWSYHFASPLKFWWTRRKQHVSFQEKNSSLDTYYHLLHESTLRTGSSNRVVMVFKTSRTVVVEIRVMKIASYWLHLSHGRVARTKLHDYSLLAESRQETKYCCEW